MLRINQPLHNQAGQQHVMKFSDGLGCSFADSALLLIQKQRLLTERSSTAPAIAAELLHHTQAWSFRRNRQSSIAAQDQDGPHGRRD